MAHDNHWQRQHSNYLYQSGWYNLRQDRVILPNGNQITYTMIEHPGYVLILPLLEDGRVLMEHVYRYTLGRTLLECPSGGLDGQPPEVAARRELEEETGYLADALTPLGRFAGNTGISNVVFDIFLATSLRPEGEIQREETEEIEIEFFPLDTLKAMVHQGEISHGPSALAVLMTVEKLRNMPSK